MASQIVMRWPSPSPTVCNGSFLPASSFSQHYLQRPPACSLSIPPGRLDSCREADFKSTSFCRPALDSRSPSWSSETLLVRSKHIAGLQIGVQQTNVRAASHTNSPAVPREDSQQASRKRIAVFVSGGGSNYKAIQSGIDAGEVNGEVVVVVSDKPGCKATEYAADRGVDVHAYPKSAKFAPDGLSAEDLVHLLKRKQVDIVLLAGFLKLLPAELVKAYPRAILNIHPALLPAFGGRGFYGLRVHAAVIKSGAWFSGPTVHFIDEDYDAGVIVAQRVVRVLPTDSPEELQARVLKEEHRLYPKVVAALCDGRIWWREDGVPILKGDDIPLEQYNERQPSRNIQAVL